MKEGRKEVRKERPRRKEVKEGADLMNMESAVVRGEAVCGAACEMVVVVVIVVVEGSE